MKSKIPTKDGREMNLEPKFKTKEIRLFRKHDAWLMKIGKGLLWNFDRG